MYHAYTVGMEQLPPTPEYTRMLNLLGALVLALSDDLHAATAAQAGHAAVAPAALVLLSTNAGQSIEWLSQTLNRSHSATVRLVDRLEQAQLLTRHTGTDGRSVALHLTDTGTTTVQALLAARQQVLAQAVRGFSAAQQAQLTLLLEAALANLVVNERHADQICRLCDESVCPLATCPVTPSEA